MKEDRPSATAQIVALNVAFVAAHPDFGRLVDPETRALNAELLGFSRRARFWLKISGRSWFHRAFPIYESCVVPGMALHQVLRKLWLEEAVERSLKDGVRQVVILGGGFDTLAARLARRHPSVGFLETDHPATQAVKRRALERAGYLGANLALASLDFNRLPLQGALQALPGYSPEAPTLVLCEGVLMYLDPAAVDRLFTGLAALPCPSLRFAFTYMEPGPDGRIAFAGSSPLVSAWLRWRRESFTWGLSRTGLEAFLSSRGFHLDRAEDEAGLRDRYVKNAEDARIAAGEKLALATRKAVAGAAS